MHRPRRCAVLLAGLCSLALPPIAARAAELTPATPDSEFLEYLGSGDDVDPALQDYLAKPDGAAAAAQAIPASKRGSDQP